MEYPRTVRQLQKCSICIMGNTRRRIQRKQQKKIFKIIMIHNLPKFISNTKPEAKEIQRTPIRINVPKLYLGMPLLLQRIIFFFNPNRSQMAKTKQKPCIWRNEDKNYIRFLLKTIQEKNVMKYLKYWEKLHQPRTLYHAKLSFKSEGESEVTTMTE